MAQEIERKFLVKGDFSSHITRSERIVQGYICSERGKTVRVQIRGEQGFLTIKGPSDAKGLSRYEFECPLSLADAEQLFQLCEPNAIDKVRHLVPVGRHVCPTKTDAMVSCHGSGAVAHLHKLSTPRPVSVQTVCISNALY